MKEQHPTPAPVEWFDFVAHRFVYAPMPTTDSTAVRYIAQDAHVQALYHAPRRQGASIAVAMEQALTETLRRAGVP